MRHLWRFLFLGVSLLALPAGAEGFSARVIAVLDGDTVLVLREGGSGAAGDMSASPLRGVRDGQRIKVRLAMIDAPEKDQEYGLASKRALDELVLRKQVQVTTQALDDYGRTVALLEVAGLNVNKEQVRRGMAWNYSHFFRDPRYRALQEEAQQARRGLWQQDDPTPPWKWRKTHPHDAAIYTQ